MKQKMTLFSFLLICIFSTNQMQAQWNKTIFDNESIDIVEADNGGSCVLGSTYSHPLVLTKRDFNGNILFHTGHSSFANPDDIIYPNSILYTQNDEYIVVGWIYKANTAFFPPADISLFAARFDALGNNLWVNEYQSSLSPSSVIRQSNMKVNIVFVEDDPSMESYILVGPGDAHGSNYSYVFPDMTIHGIRIDENGSPIWDKKFLPPVLDRQGIYSNIYAIEDYPMALTYANFQVGGGVQDVYFIAGLTVNWYYNSFGSSSDFCMGIDKDGNIVNQYSDIGTPGVRYGANYEAIFDASANRVVLASNFYNPLGLSSYTVLGVTKFDDLLNPTSSNYYEYTGATQNHMEGISLDASTDNYIIASTLEFESANLIKNAAILKIDKTSMNSQFYHRYNYLRFSSAESIMSITDPNSGIENYVMAANVSNPSGARVISTNDLGVSCGDRVIPVNSGTSTYAPLSRFYDVLDFDAQSILFSQTDNLAFFETDCANSANPDTYKKEDGNALETSLLGENIMIYPTLLTSDKPIVTIETMTIASEDVKLILFSADGKQLAEMNFLMEEGNQSTNWTLPGLQTGNYFISIEKGNETKYQKIIFEN